MEVGSVIQFCHDNEIKTGQIYDMYCDYNNDYCYDVISLNERNVPLESIIGTPNKDDIVGYIKNGNVNEVYVVKVDKWSQSTQVKMFYRSVTQYSSSKEPEKTNKTNKTTNEKTNKTNKTTQNEKINRSEPNTENNQGGYCLVM